MMEAREIAAKILNRFDILRPISEADLAQMIEDAETMLDDLQMEQVACADVP